MEHIKMKQLFCNTLQKIIERFGKEEPEGFYKIRMGNLEVVEELSWFVDHNFANLDIKYGKKEYHFVKHYLPTQFYPNQPEDFPDPEWQ